MLRLRLLGPRFAAVGALLVRGRGQYDRADRAVRHVGFARQAIFNRWRAVLFADCGDGGVELGDSAYRSYRSSFRCLVDVVAAGAPLFAG